MENTAHHLTRYFDKLTGYYFVTQLALFLAAQPLLDSETIVSVLKLIPEPSQGSPRGKEAEEDADVGRKENFELERRALAKGREYSGHLPVALERLLELVNTRVCHIPLFHAGIGVDVECLGLAAQMI